MLLAHVGDSTMVLGRREAHVSMDGCISTLKARVLSNDHKPADPTERERIESIGGQVVVSAKGATGCNLSGSTTVALMYMAGLVS